MDEHLLSLNERREGVARGGGLHSHTFGIAPGLSVCLSVCLSQDRVLPKRLHVGSRKQCYTIAQGLCSFFNE